MAIDYAALERLSYGERGPARGRLTPEILGRIIAYAWQVSAEDRFGELVGDDMFAFLLQPDLEPPPPTISNILHVDERVDGRYLEERTRLIAGAQSADAVGRLNPSHVPPVYKTDLVQASFLLKQQELDFPAEAAWVRRAIKKVIDSPGAVPG